MQTINLTTRLRSESGKGAARRLRREGLVPGVFYGPNRAPKPISFAAKEFHDSISGHEGASIVQLRSESGELQGRFALLKETQNDALTGRVLHADLYEIDMQHTIRVPVALHFVGKPAGAIRGGVLQPICREVEVECMPTDIPEFIEVDVSSLDLQESLHVSQLVLAPGLSVPFDDDFAIVTIAVVGGDASSEPGTAPEAAPVAAATT